MARTPVLTSSTLSPFGGGGGGFGPFSVVNPGREAYLTFLKVKISWQNGEISNATYLEAFQKYVSAQTPGTSTALEAAQSLRDTTTTLARNDLLAAVTTGDKTLADLVAFDKAALAGLDHGSQEFLDKQNAYWGSENQVFNDAEKDVVTQYQNGTLTATALQSWYRDQAGTFTDNPDLVDAITKQITTLDGRILDERDAQTITDYSSGKMSDNDFLAYANAARSRYVSGTSQAADWDKRITDAQTNATENGLLYRYGLSQQYAQLEQFVKSNGGKPAGGTSTSTRTRIVLGADGKWHTVKTTSTKATAPTANEIAAYKKLQIQLADAKKQMSGIVAELGAAPDKGGFVGTFSMIGYYTRRQADLVKGSGDWYAMQQKIDSLNQQLHQEKVLSQEGIKITYPPLAGAPAAPAGAPKTAAKSGTTIESFMSAIAKVESGGSYTAKNASSGAYGKYQIMPANWPSWAQKYLGSASAAQTPENQEKVVKAKMTELYNHLGSWEAVAYWWHNGGTKAEATNASNYGKYVANVMGSLGVRLPSGASSGAPGAGTAGGGSISPTATGAGGPAIGSKTNPLQGKVGGLTVVTSINRVSARSGSANLGLAPSSFPVNLDGSAFTKFYSNYVNAFQGGADSFTDNSTGRPVTYFIGDDPAERLARMEQLDSLRVGYYQARAEAYAGTPSEITAAEQMSQAVADAAGNFLRALDTPTIGKGGATGANEPNVIASGLKLLDQTESTVKQHLAMAKAAYERGDVTTAYAELQLAQNTATPVVSPKGVAQGTIPSLQRSSALADQMYAAFQKAYPGMSPEQALGADAAKQWQADYARLKNAIPDLMATINLGDELAGTLKSQVKLDSSGNVIKDPRTGEIALDDGWARFIDPSGRVTIKSVPTSGVTPDGLTHTPKGYTKTTVQVGSTVETAYAPFTVGQVGWFKGSDGVNRPINGKIVEMTVNGKKYRYVEDPLNPGHWSSVGANGQGAIVYNMPDKLKAVPGANGSTVYQFAGDNNITYSLAFDDATGTYQILGNRPGGLGSSEIVDQAVGDPGAANVLALLGQNGITRDTASIGGQDGFVDTPYPVAGMTADQFNTYLKGPPLSGAAASNTIPKAPRPSLISGSLQHDYSPDELALITHQPKPIGSGPASGGLSPDERDERTALGIAQAAGAAATITPALTLTLPPLMTATQQAAAKAATLAKVQAAESFGVRPPPTSTKTATTSTKTTTTSTTKTPVKLAPLPIAKKPATTSRTGANVAL